MNKLSAKLTVFLASLAVFAGTAHAAPVTYDFTASDFVAVNPSDPVPYSTISGSYTLDGSTLTQIDLTIGSHTYSLGEVTFDSVAQTLGGTVNGVNVFGNTDDFLLVTDTTAGSFLFAYSIPETAEVFSTQTGAVMPAVPVPASAWLLGSGLIGLAGLGRKRRHA